ncbi:unnamed protein product [Orchesella dallaii]|uniref:Uncharacterized protein n=1 Tax=Orchesella dallaii TaxID=48710 RepID=A0ABP1QLX3_9HEXA
MSSSENEHQDLRKIIREKLEILLHEDNPNPKLVQVLTSCGDVNDVAESVVDLEIEVKKEALKFRTELKSYIQFQIEAFELVVCNSDLEMNHQSYLATKEKFEPLELAVSTFESKMEEALEAKNFQWEEIAFIIKPGGLERILLTLAVEDPNGMDEQLEIAKARVDGLHGLFKAVKDEWDLIKEGVDSGIQNIIQEIESHVIVM